jgi:hypothetical protein
MALDNEGDWGGDNLPLFIREHIREVDVAMERLAESVLQLRAAVGGYAVGAQRASAGRVATTA